MHPDRHSAGEVTQFCFVSISLGAQVLLLSEFVTFTHDISLNVFGPSVALDLDRAWILGGFCVPAMTLCIIDGFK